MPDAQRSHAAHAPATPDPARVLPITARVIVRYAKRGRMRFASHRDIARAVERGVRRAGLPIAYSAGFTPHPKISYAGAAPTGTASEAEYLEISPHRGARRFRGTGPARCGPAGRDRCDRRDRGSGIPRRPPAGGIALAGGAPRGPTGGRWPRRRDAFLARGSLEVERLTAKGSRRVDARAAVITMETDRCAADTQAAGNAILRMVVRHVMPAVRPDDILAALRQVAGLAPSSPPLVTRLAQGPLGHGGGQGPRAEAPGPDVPGDPRRPSGPATRASTGPGRAHDQEETTRLGAEPAAADALPADACDQLPRGTEAPLRSSVPGSLTGDNPDARDRAERCRTQTVRSAAALARQQINTAEAGGPPPAGEAGADEAPAAKGRRRTTRRPATAPRRRGSRTAAPPRRTRSAPPGRDRAAGHTFREPGSRGTRRNRRACQEAAEPAGTAAPGRQPVPRPATGAPAGSVPPRRAPAGRAVPQPGRCPGSGSGAAGRRSSRRRSSSSRRRRRSRRPRPRPRRYEPARR